MEIIFSTKTTKSRVSKNPKIYTNVDKAPKSVRISATVTQRPDSTYPLVMKPYKLDIGQFRDQVRKQASLTITNVSDQDWKIKTIDLPKDFFAVKLPAQIKAGQSAELMVTLTDYGIEQEFTKSFTIEVNDSETTRYTIPVKRKKHKAKL